MEEEDFLTSYKRKREATLETLPQTSLPPEETEEEDFLEAYKQKRPTQPEPTFAPVAVTEEPVPSDFINLENKVYSENSLLEEEFYRPIEGYMVDRFGDHIRDLDREDVVNMYANNMRGFSGGNSVRTVNEISYLNEINDDEEKMARAGQAYEIFNGMQTVFGETSWSEKAEIVLDYTRSAVLDPVNVLSLGAGKVATGGGFKLGSQMALISAKQAYKKAINKGLSISDATELGAKTLRVATKIAKRKATREATKRQAIEAAATTTLQRMTTRTALKEAAVVGTIESAIAAGTDYLYQDAMLRTAVQEEYNVYQTGLSAVVGLVAGGLSGAASNVGTGASRTVAPEKLKTSTFGSKSLSKVVNQTPSSAATPSSAPYVPGASNWLKDVAKGKELADQDSKFFYTMLLGDSDKGLKGLAHTLLEDGYVWTPRTVDDKVSNWVGDIIKYADPQDAKKFIDDFTKATGIEMAEGKQLTLEAFADTFKRKMSDSGYVMSAASQVARLLGREAKDITLDDYASVILGGVGSKTSKASAKVKTLGAKLGDIVVRDIPDFQNNLIRLMVSNLSTTALNVTGYAAASSLNSAADVARAVLLGGKAGLELLTKPANARETASNALGILANQKQKALFTLDPNTTYDTFLRYSELRPKSMSQLTQVLPGGVESLEKLGKGFDPDKPLLTLASNQAVDFIARLNFVSAQDGYTKSIEFLTQMDKLLRRPEKEGGFGMSWNQFFSAPDQHKKMLSERFVTLEAKAVNDTLETVFSKSYKGEDFIGEVAGVIEDARNIPGIGMLVPFGRFFNNTIGAAYDATGILPFISKVFGGEQDKFYSEIFAKGVVSLSLLSILAKREEGFIDLGLGWSEEIDAETGEIIDERYEFPYGAYKAAARIVAMQNKGQEVPKELVAQIGDQFLGQLTRQLGEAGEGLGNIFTILFSDEGPDFSEVLSGISGTIGSQVVSAATRPLEPLNVLAGLSRDEEYYTPDRNQGEKAVNNSMRYLDQIIALFRGNENVSPPAFSAAEGKPRTTPSRLISTTRATKLTNVERVMNSIGKDTWTASMSSLSDAADSRYNDIFNTMVERGALDLWNSKSFREGDLELKRNKVATLLNSAKESTLSFMESGAARGGDTQSAQRIRISRGGKSKEAIRRTMEKIGLDKEFEELSPQELDVLEATLKYTDEFLKNK
jgi:hypothetical protein